MIRNYRIFGSSTRSDGSKHGSLRNPRPSFTSRSGLVPFAVEPSAENNFPLVFFAEEYLPVFTSLAWIHAPGTLPQYPGGSGRSHMRTHIPISSRPPAVGITAWRTTLGCLMNESTRPICQMESFSRRSPVITGNGQYGPMRRPGFEPGFRRWQRLVITTTLSAQCSSHLELRDNNFIERRQGRPDGMIFPRSDPRMRSLPRRTSPCHQAHRRGEMG